MFLPSTARLLKLGIRLNPAALVSGSTFVFTWYLLLITTSAGNTISKRCDIINNNVAQSNVETAKPHYPTGIKYHCVSLEKLKLSAASQWVCCGILSTSAHILRTMGLIKERLKTQWNWVFFSGITNLVIFPVCIKIAYLWEMIENEAGKWDLN